MPMMELFDKQIQIRMGQANVRRWVDDILPLLTATATRSAPRTSPRTGSRSTRPRAPTRCSRRSRTARSRSCSSRERRGGRRDGQRRHERCCARCATRRASRRCSASPAACRGCRCPRWSRAAADVAARRARPALSRGGRGRSPRLADPTVARPGAAPSGSTWTAPRASSAPGAGGRGLARLRVVGRGVLARAEGAARGRVAGPSTASDELLQPSQGGGRAAARPLRGRALGGAGRADAAGADLQARGRHRDPAALRRALPAEPTAPSELWRVCRTCRACASRPCTRSTSARRTGLRSCRTSGARSTSRRSRSSTRPPSPRIFDARTVKVPSGAARVAVDAAYRLRLQPTPPGWLDLALAVPLLDSYEGTGETRGGSRASAPTRRCSSWSADCGSEEGIETPPLASDTGGPLRVRELLTGVGARDQ